MNFYEKLNEVEKLNAIIIGAMDGVSHDNIKNYINKPNSNFIFVEPVKYYMDQLKENFGTCERFIFVEKAIHSYTGILEFVKIKDNVIVDAHLSKCLGGLTTINPPKNNMKDIINDPEYKDLIEYVTFDCITVDDLKNEIDLNEINYIQIDTEGHDLEILKQFDLSNIQFIKVEHWHLSEKEKQELFDILENNGFNVVKELEDVYATK